MNIAMILAAGVGQRMRSGGLPKQFLKLAGKPIVIYTLEKFEQCDEIDEIVVVCHGCYIEYMQDLIEQYRISKVRKIVVGGSDRQNSILRGLNTIREDGGREKDIVMIHDGVRPLVNGFTIHENVRVAKQYGCAITVRPVTESVVVTDLEEVGIADFKKRDDTYSMTSPQTFMLGEIIKAYGDMPQMGSEELPLLDAAMVYAKMGKKLHLVKEHGVNIKITTPEDFYFLKALLELEENKYIFGL